MDSVVQLASLTVLATLVNAIAAAIAASSFGLIFMRDPAGIPFNRRSINPGLNCYDYSSAKISAKTHAVVINGNYAKRVPRRVGAGFRWC
jgi:hypothetical protein